MPWIILEDGGDSDSAVVGAARAAASVSTSLLDSLTRVGVLPATPLQWRNYEDAGKIAAALLNAAERAGLDRGALSEELERADVLRPPPVLFGAAGVST
jgi:hypothetical protein